MTVTLPSSRNRPMASSLKRTLCSGRPSIRATIPDV